MIAELGQFALLIALALSVLQSFMPLAGVYRRRVCWMVASFGLARAQCGFVFLALLALAWLFYQNDFSVAYVANNSNSQLPVIYRICAIWGGHEGSLLLWSFMLSFWTALVSIFARQIPLPMLSRVLSVLGMVNVGFLLFMILTSNPFDRLWPAAVEGRDLNPLLQDPGLIVHPPMLYMGYVGFSVAFAFAVAALLAGRMDSAWARWARTWTLAAWAFLTLGIMLGSWWAYYELGWGGWWFWDPVENASFMPWLVGTALVHSLAVTEARALFKPWTALLAIVTFSLCLLGAFLVRSGVLTSVHAFATDPERGLFILMLLFIATASGLILYAWRAPQLLGAASFGLVSREIGILINNILLSAAAFCVLLGTLYPLILEAVGAPKISVGPPYFNRVFVPLAGASALFIAAGALSRWKSDKLGRLAGKLAIPAGAALGFALLLPLAFYGEYSIGATAGLTLAGWVLFATGRAAYDRVKSKAAASGGFWGMIVAHAGVGVFIVGVTVVSAYGLQEDVLLREGERHPLGPYEFEMLDVRDVQGPNYAGIGASVRVWKDDREITTVYPEKRRYFTQPENPMTEAGLAIGIIGDWYVSLGEPLAAGGWSARLQFKPFIRLVWLGALLMAIGAAISISDRRYRQKGKSAAG